MSSEKIAMIGLGNMGTALAQVIAGNGHEVAGWEFFPEVVEEVNGRHGNSRFLPDVVLDGKIFAITDLKQVLTGAGLIFSALPSNHLRRVLKDFVAFALKDALWINCAKGVEAESGLTSRQVLAALAGEERVLQISGGSIANEFARGLPCAVVLAGKDSAFFDRVAGVLENRNFRVVYSTDLAGVEWCGILKNVYALGLGLMDGLGFVTTNFTAAYLTHAAAELAGAVELLGGKKETAFGLAGLGDLLATSLSPHSHNRGFGERLARGESMQQITDSGLSPEGVRTLNWLLPQAEARKLKLPLASALKAVLDGRRDAKDAVSVFLGGAEI